MRNGKGSPAKRRIKKQRTYGNPYADEGVSKYQKEFGKGCADCPAWQEEHSHLIWMAIGVVTGMIVAAVTVWRIL